MPARFPLRSRRRRTWLVAVLGTAACALGGASGASAAFVGTADDPAGDAAAPEPARDIVAAAVGYDRAGGQLQAAFAVREKPIDVSSAVAVAYVGRRSSTGCDRGPTVGLTTLTTGLTAQWARFDVPGTPAAQGRADKRAGRDRVQQVEAEERRLAGLTPDCAVVSFVDAGGQQVLYDTVTIDLRPVPSLGIKLSGVPANVRRGRSYTLKVTLSNPGDAPTGTTRVRLKAIRGLTLKRSHRVASIAAGRSRTLRVRVTVTPRAGGAEYFDATATAGGLKAEARRRTWVRYGATSGTGGGRPGGTPSTCVRYFPDLSGESGGSLGLVPCLR